MFRMDPHFDRLLRGSDELPLGLYQLYMVTPEQLTALHYGKSLTHVKELLKILCEQGYAQYDGYPVKHVRPDKIFYSTRYFYTLGPEGVKYLRRLGMDVKSADAPKPDLDTFPMILKHQLELNDLVISAALLKQGFYLNNLWTQQEMNERPYIARWSNDRYKLVPDAFLEFGIEGTNSYHPLLLEYDRYTEFGRSFTRKIRAYALFLREEGYRQYGASKITICFCTHKGEHRRNIMRDTVQAELQDKGLWGAFLFANLPQPPDDRVWLNPYWYSVVGGPHALLAV